LQDGYVSNNERANTLIQETLAHEPITLGKLSRIFDTMQLDEALTDQLLAYVTTCKPEDRLKLLQGAMHKIASALVDEHFHLIPSLQLTFPDGVYTRLVGVKSNTDYEDSEGYTSLEDVLMQAIVVAYYANLQTAFDKKLEELPFPDDVAKTAHIQEFTRTIIHPLSDYSKQVRVGAILNEVTFVQCTYNWFSMFLSSIRLWPPATVEQRATRLMAALDESRARLINYSEGLADGPKKEALQGMQAHLNSCGLAVECVLDTIQLKREHHIEVDEAEVAKSITDVCELVATSITDHLRPLINEHKSQLSPLALAWEKLFHSNDLSLVKNKLIASDTLIREMALQSKSSIKNN